MNRQIERSALGAWWHGHTPADRAVRLGIGGGGLDRKPLGLLCSLLAKDLIKGAHAITPVGGLDVDLLIAHGALSELTASYVGLERYGLAPHFRAARQSGALRFNEWSEFAVVGGLRAACERLPFYPARIGGDVVAQAGFRPVEDPYSGERLVAIPALPLDIALIHADLADAAGNAVILGAPHVDPLMARTACTTLLSCERLVSTDELLQAAGRAGCDLLAIDVGAVLELPGGYGSRRSDASVQGAEPAPDRIRAYLAAAAERAPAEGLRALMQERS